MNLDFCMYCGTDQLCSKHENIGNEDCVTYRLLCQNYRTSKAKRSVKQLEEKYRSEKKSMLYTWWNRQWDSFKANFQDGDEIWHVYYGGSRLDMREGYCILRNGEPVDMVITCLS